MGTMNESTSFSSSAPVPMSLRRVIAIEASYVATFALGALLTFGIVYTFTSRAPVQAAVPPPSPAQETAVPTSGVTEMPVADVHATLDGARDSMRLGSPDAPVQIVVFADPQCPFCKKSATETEPQIVEQFVKTGQASLVYRHFAFLGPESQRIAVAMECAAQQGRFWAFHQRVYEQQFPENAGLATDEALRGWARDAGVDMARFTDCTGKPEVAAQVVADTNAGRRLGVAGTPTLFINGRPMPGALPFDFVKTAIEAQLATAHVTPQIAPTNVAPTLMP